MLVMTPSVGGEASPFVVSRRSVLGVTGVVAGLLLSPGALAQRELIETGTPQLTLGPFYPVVRGAESDWDMTRVAGVVGQAKGVVMELSGVVRAISGVPVPGALLDAWQTNGLGRYHHPSDPSSAPLDPAFQGRALVRADANGRYLIRTVIPTPYARRQRHIHFDVQGSKRRLITQMFFPGEPNNADTLWPRILTEAQRDAAVARVGGERDGIKRFEWDIVLAGE